MYVHMYVARPVCTESHSHTHVRRHVHSAYGVNQIPLPYTCTYTCTSAYGVYRIRLPYTCIWRLRASNNTNHQLSNNIHTVQYIKCTVYKIGQTNNYLTPHLADHVATSPKHTTQGVTKATSRHHLLHTSSCFVPLLQ
jgi:hypothetical protein